MTLILDNIIFDMQKAGGISKFWSKHIEKLCLSNFNCCYIETNKSTENLFRSEILISPKDLVIQRPILPMLSRYLDSNCSNLGGTVFHSSYFRNPSKNMAVVHTVHDFMYELFDKGLRKNIHIMQKVAAMRRADVIVCVSDHTKQDMYKLYPWTRRKKVEVIYNGVDSEFYEIKDKEGSIVIDGVEIEDKSFLLYVGSRGYCKNFPMVLRLLSSEYARDFNLKLVCVGGGTFSVEERNQLVDLGLDNRVILFSSLESSLLNLLYNYAQALLMPSIYEGFGIPALEAAKAGCLVIGANNSALPEILGSNDFLFSPCDYEQANWSLNRLDNKKYSASIRIEVKKKTLSFSWEHMTNNYMAIYKMLGLNDERI